MLLPDKKIFIDGGGNFCQGIEKYLKNFPSYQKIYVFEPNPFFFESYNNSKFELIKKAIWIENCQLPFYVSKDPNQVASSLLQEKLCKVDSQLKPYWQDESIKVDCIDFSMWIKETINPHDFVTLKLDIEGAEYDVLWKMIKDKTINLINELFVEFHLETIASKKDQHDKLLKELKNLNIVPQHWD